MTKPVRVSEERLNGASGTRCDIDAAKPEGADRELGSSSQSIELKLTHVPVESQHVKFRTTFPAGIEPTSKV